MANILWSDTVTTLGRHHADTVVVGGSHGGVYAGYLAAKAHVKAIILHDAGVGKDNAGIGALSYLEKIGMPAATINYQTARIADGQDQLNRGFISHINHPAFLLGCRAGQSTLVCAKLMISATSWEGAIPEFGESRFLLRKAKNPNMPMVWGIDSTSLLRSKDENCIIVTASHGALFGNTDNRVVNKKPLAMVFNDAGIGIDQWGVSRLKHLDRQGIIAVTVGCNSARIGDSRSAWKTGIISCANTEAANAGIKIGETLENLADKLASTI